MIGFFLGFTKFKAGQFTGKGDLTNFVNFVPGSIRSPWSNLFHIRLRKPLILILNLQFIESVTKIEVSIDVIGSCSHQEATVILTSTL